MKEKELLNLMEKYIEGELQEAEQTELESILKSSKKARKLFWDYNSVHSNLRELMAVQKGQESLQVTKSKKNRNRRNSHRNMTEGHSSWRNVILIAATILIAVGLFLVYNNAYTHRPIGFVKKSSADITLIRSGNIIKATPKTALFSGDIIQVSANGSLEMQYTNENTTIRIAQNSIIKFNVTGGAKKIELTKGTITASVAPQGKAMEIKTSNSICKVVGTVFRLSSNFNKEKKQPFARLEVLEGAVEITRLRDLKSLMIKSGKYATVSDATTFEAKMLDDSNNLALNAGFENGANSWHRLQFATKNGWYDGREVVSNVVKSGKKSVRFNSSVKYDHRIVQDIELNEKTIINISAWLKLKDLDPKYVSIKVLFLSLTKNEMSQQLKGKMPGLELGVHTIEYLNDFILKEEILTTSKKSEEWIQISKLITSPEKTKAMRVIFYLEPSPEAGRLWIDDLKITKKEFLK